MPPPLYYIVHSLYFIFIKNKNPLFPTFFRFLPVSSFMRCEGNQLGYMMDWIIMNHHSVSPL